MALGDIPYWYCLGAGIRCDISIIKLSTFIFYVAGMPITMVYTNYLASYLGLEKNRRKWIGIITSIIFVLFIISAIINLKLGFYYTIDEETFEYSRGEYWLLSHIIPGLALIYDFILLFIYRKRLLLSARIGTILYITLPIIGAVIQAIFDGVPTLIWFVAIALFILYFTLNTEMQYLMERQRKELVESKTTIMLSQIQPHFLYNSLTTIAALCEKSPLEAKRATLDFSRYLRCNIDSVNKRIPVPFKQELEHVQTYLNLEKLRFEKRLNIIMDIQVTDFLIPALTIQPIVENAVKHGICNKEGGNGTLILTTLEDEKNYKIIIRDDGQGFDTTKKPDDGREHIGIENVKHRLYSMIGATMQIESEIGRGTIVTVLVPKEKTKKRPRRHEE
ncbi:MAG: histidine kinase [Lachnospiraceae bacterium]|nr:histidine kinase [Lachnospiraceae bacterium]